MRRTLITGAIVGVTLASLVLAPGVARAGRIGSQVRRQGRVAENRVLTRRTEDQVARRIAVQFLTDGGVDREDAATWVAGLSRDEAIDVAFTADLTWTLQEAEASGGGIDWDDVGEGILVGLAALAVAGYYTLLVMAIIAKCAG